MIESEKKEREREKELREFRLDRESRRGQTLTAAIDDGSRLITTLYTVMRA